MFRLDAARYRNAISRVSRLSVYPKSRANLRAVPGLSATVLSEIPSGGFYRGSMSFSHLGLSDKVLAAVAATGYTTPTPIQEQAIPHVLARRDVLGKIGRAHV